METETITPSSRMSSGITVELDSPPIGSSSSSPNTDGFFSTNGKSNYIRIGLIVTILLFLASDLEYNITVDPGTGFPFFAS